MAPLLAQYLSWNTARLIALILNALNGIENYYEQHLSELNVDGLFGLRVIQGQLKSISTDLEGSNLDRELMNALYNLSGRANEIAGKAIPYVIERDPSYYQQFRYLLNRPYTVKHSIQRSDERLRWLDKELVSRRFGIDEERTMWFDEKQSD
ncbi:unnamed protein product, partial [Anisakis simplex]|uniref:Integrative and conjugative element protein n=1 Tax=Anisakis simplex TaxID=6269 RepID=A0A0M3J514_ANISI